MAHQDVDFRTYTIRFFLPIIVCLIIVLIMSQSTLNFYFNLEQTPPPSATPVQPNETGSNQTEVGLANMLIYVFMAFSGGVVILFLMRKGLLSIVQLLFGAILGLSAFVLGLFFYGLVLMDFFNILIRTFSFLQNHQVINFLTWMYLFLVFGSAIISGIIGFLVMIDVRWVPMVVRNGAIVMFGAAVGSYLGVHFPVMSAVFVLIGLAIYDIYAVFKGPLRGILKEMGMSSATEDEESAKEGDENVLTKQELDMTTMTDLPTEKIENTSMVDIKERNITVASNGNDEAASSLITQDFSSSLKEEDEKQLQEDRQEEAQLTAAFPGLPIYSDGVISIGLGDFAFYSMLVSHALKITWLLELNFIPLILTLLGVLTGALITLRWLVKQKVLPGLPMAIFLGILGLFIGIVIAIPDIGKIQWLLSQ